MALPFVQSVRGRLSECECTRVFFLERIPCGGKARGDDALVLLGRNVQRPVTSQCWGNRKTPTVSVQRSVSCRLSDSPHLTHFSWGVASSCCVGPSQVPFIFRQDSYMQPGPAPLSESGSEYLLFGDLLYLYPVRAQTSRKFAHRVSVKSPHGHSSRRGISFSFSCHNFSHSKYVSSKIQHYL